MAIQSAAGWILDVRHEYTTGIINLLIKLEDSKVISFKQRLPEHLFYILPKPYQAGQDIFQQLSRNDHLVKRLFWDEKYIDLQDKTKTRLIRISVANPHLKDFQILIKKLGIDSRVRSMYNTELSAIHHFIYNQLKIAPTSKVRIEYEQEVLLSVSRIDDSKEISPPSFRIVHIRIGDNDNKT